MSGWLEKTVSLWCLCVLVGCLAAAPDPSPAPLVIVPSDIVINEIKARGQGPDWIELYNSGDDSIDISGWGLVDSKIGRDPYVIPDGTHMAAHSFWIVRKDDVDGRGFAFGLGTEDQVFLLDGARQVRSVLGWHATDVPLDRSYGRRDDGGEEAVTWGTPTPGQPNVALLSPGIHPPPPKPMPVPYDPEDGGWNAFSFGDVPKGSYTILSTSLLLNAPVMVKPFFRATAVPHQTMSINHGADYITIDSCASYVEGLVVDQPFQASGGRVTNVFFRTAKNNPTEVVVSIHAVDEDVLSQDWPPLGPERSLSVESDRMYSVEWSGSENTTMPGQSYVLRIRALNGDVFRLMRSAKKLSNPGMMAWLDGEEINAQLCAYVGSNSGALRTSQARPDLAMSKTAPKATRYHYTFVASGDGLAGGLLYSEKSLSTPAAVTWEVRADGIDGPSVGVVKTVPSVEEVPGVVTSAVAYAPGEVPLVPGKTYVMTMQTGGMRPFLTNEPSTTGQSAADTTVLELNVLLSTYEYCGPLDDCGAPVEGPELRVSLQPEIPVIGQPSTVTIERLDGGSTAGDGSELSLQIQSSCSSATLTLSPVPNTENPMWEHTWTPNTGGSHVILVSVEGTIMAGTACLVEGPVGCPIQNTKRVHGATALVFDPDRTVPLERGAVFMIPVGAGSAFAALVGQPVGPSEETPLQAVQMGESSTDMPTGIAPSPCIGGFDPIQCGGGDVPSVPPWHAPRGSSSKNASIFAEMTVVDFHLMVEDEDWAALMQSKVDKVHKYVPCVFEFEGERFEKAAVRLKGIVSDWDQPKYQNQFIIRFDWQDKAGRFRGLRRLNLDVRKRSDARILNNVGMYAMRRAGVPASRTNHARLFINGQYDGLFENIEPVDREWLEDRYIDPDGDLYGGGELKTNSATGSIQELGTFVEVAVSPYDPSVVHQYGVEPPSGLWSPQSYLEWFSTVAFEGEMLQMMAVEAWVCAVENFWSKGLGSSVNTSKTHHWNFYLYNDPRSGMTAIPWDLDIIMDGYYSSPTTDPFTFQDPFHSNPETQPPNQPWRKLQHFSSERDQMLQRLARLNRTFMASLPTVVARYCALVRPHVLADPHFKRTDSRVASPEASFDSQCSELQDWAAQRVEYIQTLTIEQ